MHVRRQPQPVPPPPPDPDIVITLSLQEAQTLKRLLEGHAPYSLTADMLCVHLSNAGVPR